MTATIAELRSLLAEFAGRLPLDAWLPLDRHSTGGWCIRDCGGGMTGGGMTQHEAEAIAAMINDGAALLDRLEAAEANYRWMVEHACDQNLDGYRELGARAAAAEELALAAEAERDAWKRAAESQNRQWSEKCTQLMEERARREATEAEVSRLRERIGDLEGLCVFYGKEAASKDLDDMRAASESKETP